MDEARALAASWGIRSQSSLIPPLLSEHEQWHQANDACSARIRLSKSLRPSWIAHFSLDHSQFDFLGITDGAQLCFFQTLYAPGFVPSKETPTWPAGLNGEL